MHPAPSIILFTTAAGAGYGLLFLLALGAPLGLIPSARGIGSAGLGLALGLITLGLMSSTVHLGHPERAWRALSQWRTSWLSREGLAALLTYLPALGFAGGWILLERTGGWSALCGLLAAAGAAATVWCTGMIYASLKPIRQWHQPLVAPLYLAFALMSGALLLHLLLAWFGMARGIAAGLALLATLLAFALKTIYWRTVDARASRQHARERDRARRARQGAHDRAAPHPNELSAQRDGLRRRPPARAQAAPSELPLRARRRLSC